MNRLENLPNEILLIIYSYITWFETIKSFWSLNKRFNSLINLKSSMNNNGIILSKRCLSFNRCHSIMTSNISDFSTLLSCIESIDIDGTNSNCSDVVSQWILHSKRIRFINLKKVVLRKCYLTEELIVNLSLLIEYQLNELILTIDKDVFQSWNSQRMSRRVPFNRESNLMSMFKAFLRQLFSYKCRLISLELDISHDDSSINIHEFFSLSSNINPNDIPNELVTHCKSLRYLKIDLIYGCLLDDITKHVPALEILSVQFKDSLVNEVSDEPHVKRFASSIVNWYDKMPKLKSFTLISEIIDNDQLVYLKSLLNKVNYIEKFKIRLDIKISMNEDRLIDIDFLRKYCLPDILIHLVEFDFYIVSKCKLLFQSDIQAIIHSFKSDQFFIDRYWINIECFFDPILSYQHISSSQIIKAKFFHGIIDYPIFFDWEHVKYIKVDLCPSIYLFLKQFHIMYPHIHSIQFNMGRHKPLTQLEYSMFLQASLDVGHTPSIDIHLRYVTRLSFGSAFYRNSAHHDEVINRNILRAEVLACLVSMPIQLIYLRIEQFQWLLDLVQYASHKLKQNALSTVRHAEFCLPSCHYGSNESVNMGKNLISILSCYMPYLQTLRLWRDDDFPWTSIRPAYETRYLCQVLSRRWIESLRTPQSIVHHVALLEENLCQLVENLTEFLFLDIYGQIHPEKIEPYQSMVKRRFPSSRLHIETSKFRLWI